MEETPPKNGKLAELLAYFQGQQPEYKVTSRWAPIDKGATRFDFVKGKTHFMLDLTDNLVDDLSASEIEKRLDNAKWWAVLQSHPAPAIVTLSSMGLFS
jgi:hypothetical protein